MPKFPSRSFVAPRDLLPPGALTNALWVSAVATGVVATWVLMDRQGWQYYTTPLAVRGYHPAHKALRPSGRVAHWLGVTGALLILFPLVYAVRKRVRAFDRLGSLRAWLEVHIFCGLVGPVLVTFHSSFKFNGLISVAYWAMVIVTLSGIVGRYLYVRIPKTIRGVELTQEQVTERAAGLKTALAEAGLSEAAMRLVEGFERSVLPQPVGSAGPAHGWFAVSWRVRSLRRLLVAEGLEPDAARQVARLTAERAALLRRLGALQRTKRLFARWHVFHLPLVWLMFAILALHVGLALYLGYWPTL